ncbi:hypothetical protein [Aquipuribacter hungaricus]|uniref:Tetratricopeptide repeat protein n=1 Tax=Aquipuribacter hungaricus TaxID=545624 RepID=A0ABV7WEW9_9MICO
MRRTKVVIAVLLLVLSFYLVGLLVRSWAVVQDGGVLGWLLAAGMVVLVGIAVLAVAAELRFGVATERLGRTLDAEGALPEAVPRSGDGRVDRAAADEAFARYRAEVEADPTSWRGWFRLALAYDSAGDRKRGRAAARHAVRLHRTPQQPS